MVTEQQLARLKIGPEWAAALNQTFDRFKINTPNRQAAFVAQCGHECGNFRVLEEKIGRAHV